jgi:alkylhydroperoxidase family enzyme
VGSALGIPKEKINDLENYATSAHYSSVERIALEYADRITVTGLDVTDEFFSRLRDNYNEDEIVELTAIIAWENSSSKFNRALRVPSQQIWQRE